MKYITLILLFSQYTCFSQKEKVIENEALLKEYLGKTHFEIDNSAKAVILFESGYSSLIGENYELEYHVERTIKILSADVAQELGTINIPAGDNTMITKIKGLTFNLENGQIVKQEIDRSDILETKITSGFAVSKFNLPGIKQGSIIHYSYTFKRPGFIFVPDWNFQGDYPKLFSEYRISIPKYIIYTPLERINCLMSNAHSRDDLETCNNCTFTEFFGANESNQYWIRKNIPAFKAEPYMSSEDNYIERVKIHVSQLYSYGHTVNINNNWNEVIKRSFYDNNDFGGQVHSNNNFLSEKIKELTADKTSASDKAKAIFAYVRDNFSQKESNFGYRAASNIKEIFDKKEGTLMGINLLLTAMLRKANLDSEPVVLSTKTSEKLNELFPDPRKINYVVSKVMIDKKNYLLDASVKEMPFGVLLPQCYNGYCRVVDQRGTSLELLPDSIKNRTTILASLTPDEKRQNRMILKLDKQLGTFAGMHYRKLWNKDTSEIRKMILKELSGGTMTIDLSNYSVKNLDDPNKPLTVHYEAEMNLVGDDKVTTIYFDPYLEKFYDKNPFHESKRKYNIEMDFQEEINYSFTMKLPAGYVVDDYPKSTIRHFNEKELLTLKNIMNYNTEDNSFSLTSKLIRQTTLFAVQDYADLKRFYDDVIEEQGKKLILKKTN